MEWVSRGSVSVIGCPSLVTKGLPVIGDRLDFENVAAVGLGVVGG